MLYLLDGNTDSSTYSTTVDAYNASLVRTTPTAMSIEMAKYRTEVGASIGNYVLFAGR